MNAVLIADSLTAAGISVESMQILHLDVATGLDTIQYGNGESILLPLPEGIKFYLAPRLDRVRYLRKAMPILKEAGMSTRVLVLGNDGSMQRVIARSVRRSGGQVFMILDGLLTPDGPDLISRLRGRLKYTAFRALELLGADHLAPSEVGYSRLDYVAVIDETVRRILCNRGVTCPIDVVMLPRMMRDAQVFRNEREERGREAGRSVVYMTSAYEWHGLSAAHELQLRDLVDLNTYALERPELRFRIRIHPREAIDWYIRQTWAPNVSLSMPDVALVDDLIAASVVVTARSTVALEAIRLGIPAAVYEKNFGPPPSGSFLANNSNLMHISRLEDLPVKVGGKSEDAGASLTWAADPGVITQRILAAYNATP